MLLTFDILSRLMVVVAVAIVAVPLLRGSQTRRVWPSVAVSALFIYLGSAVVYPLLSNWTHPGDSAPLSATTQATDLDALHREAAARPDDPAGWFALGSRLMQAQRPADAVPALEKVYELTGGRDAEPTLLLIDALMMSDTTAAARGRVSALVEQLLAVVPDHPKALFYGAELALARNDLPTARARMQRLLERAVSDPSAEAQRVRAVLEQRIA